MTDIVLEIVRAAVLLVIFIYLLRIDAARFLDARRGWTLVVGGFGLLLFGSLLDISDNFESLNRFVVIGDTEVEAFLEKFVGFLGGFSAVALGLMLWIPKLQQLGSEVAERNLAEAALRASESALARAQRQARIGSWRWSVERDGLVSWSEEYARIHGVGPDEIGSLMDRQMERVIHPDDRERVEREFERFDDEGADYEIEYRIVRPDGEVRHVLEIGEAMRHEAGRAVEQTGTVQDITEQKRAEDALRRAHDELEKRVGERTAELRESEELFSKAFHASPALFSIIDPEDGVYCDVNDTWVKTLGFGRDEALGKSALDLGVWVDPSRRAHFVGRLEKEGSVRGFETKLRAKGGEELDILISGESVEIGGERRFFLIAHDITQRKRTEERLVQAQRMEAIGQLTGGVAHDFNNLLGVIMGNVELLAEELGEDETHVRSILQAALRGGELTERLLSFSRQQPLKAQVIEIGVLAGGITDMLARALGETIELKIVMDSDLWAISVDPGQLENALLNLAINARDAMPAGGKLTIEAANATLDEDYAASHLGAKPGDYAVLAVSDTGTGMPPEVLEHAFEPFFTTKEVGAGSGLGLSMVYGFAKQSGGYIAIYSELGHGSMVKLYLPRAEAGARPSVEAVDEEAPRARGETVLLVEDDPDLRSLAVSMLKSLGYRVMEAENGETALAALETAPDLDLLLSDVVLPGGMTGFEIAREATLRHDSLKVLLMSGYAENAVRHSGALERAQEVLNKPFRRHTLAQKLRAVLDGGGSPTP